MPTTAAWQSADDPPPRRPPEINHHRPRLRSAAYQAAPPRRDATPTTLLPGQVLGFPPVRGGRWGIATPDTLQEGIVAPAGVTASEPDEPARISPALQTAPPNRSRQAKPPPNTMRHRNCAATHVDAAYPTANMCDMQVMVNTPVNDKGLQATAAVVDKGVQTEDIMDKTTTVQVGEADARKLVNQDKDHKITEEMTHLFFERKHPLY